MHTSRRFIPVREPLDHPGRLRRAPATAVGSAAAMFLLAISASCSGASDSTPTTQATTSAHPAPSSSVASTAPSATPRPTAPPELQGAWQATISTGEDVTLTLSPYGYTVRRSGATGTGSIDVDGDRVVFRSPRCEIGAGAYQWAIDDGALTFTPLEPRDPCGGRIIFLEDAVYTRTD